MSKTTATTIINMADDLPNDTAELHIVKPGTNIRTGWIITLAGPGHPQTIEMMNEGERERLHRSAEIERAQVNGRKWKGDDEQPEESRRKFVSRVVRRIVGWTPVDFGSGPVEFSQENATKLFMDPKMGSFFVQIVDFLTADRAFMKGSASS
jgi:hypothetical protein